MKTGIIRRIDDLGRIVIPKEIRRELGFTENTPVEISTENGHIVLEKYETMDSISKSIMNLLNDAVKRSKISCAVYSNSRRIFFSSSNSSMWSIFPSEPNNYWNNYDRLFIENKGSPNKEYYVLPIKTVHFDTICGYIAFYDIKNKSTIEFIATMISAVLSEKEIYN